MLKAILRALASLSLIAGAVVLFIDYNGGTVRLGVEQISTPDAQEHHTFLVTLPHTLPIGITLLVAAALLFVVSRTLGKKAQSEASE